MVELLVVQKVLTKVAWKGGTTVEVLVEKTAVNEVAWKDKTTADLSAAQTAENSEAIMVVSKALKKVSVVLLGVSRVAMKASSLVSLQVD